VKKSAYSRLHVTAKKFPAVNFPKQLTKYPLCEMHSIKALQYSVVIEYDKKAQDFVDFRKQALNRICDLAKLICQESGEPLGTREQGAKYDLESKTGRACAKVPAWLHHLSLSHPDSRDRCLNPIEGANDCLTIGDPVAAEISEEKFTEFMTSTIKNLATRVQDTNSGKPGASVGPFRCSAKIKSQPDGRCTNFTHSEGAYCKRCEKTPGVSKHDSVEPDNLTKVLNLIREMI
jgi:hypothetical protein